MASATVASAQTLASVPLAPRRLTRPGHAVHTAAAQRPGRLCSQGAQAGPTLFAPLEVITLPRMFPSRRLGVTVARPAVFSGMRSSRPMMSAKNRGLADTAQTVTVGEGLKLHVRTGGNEGGHPVLCMPGALGTAKTDFGPQLEVAPPLPPSIW